jgi:hypothetical protein
MKAVKKQSQTKPNKANFTAPPRCPEGSAQKKPTSDWVGLVKIILPILTLRLETAFE